MPPPNLATLQAAPDQLLPWLNANILTAGTVQNVPAPNGLAWVRIEPRPVPPSGAVNAVDAAGGAVGLYQLRTNGTGIADAVRAYICNYTAHNVHSVDIGNLGDFVFTTNLNGCTYGIGPAAPNGSRRVSHANSGGAIGTQRTQTWNQHGVPANSTAVKMLEPSLYRNNLIGSAQATVFGIRSGLNWDFYFQSYDWDLGSRTFTLHGVFPI